MIEPLTLDQARNDVIAVIDMLDSIPEEQRSERLQQLLDDLQDAIVQYDASAPPAMNWFVKPEHRLIYGLVTLAVAAILIVLMLNL